VLALLRRAAAERPLLIVVDDAHWADRPTAALLGFVARRLASTRIGLLLAFRPGVEGAFDRSDLPRHDLARLPDGEAAILLATRFPTLGARATHRVLADAEGNPLALLELPLALAGASGRPQLTDSWSTLPLSGRLTSLYSARVRALPPDTQRLLLLAALEGTGDLATVLAAAGPGSGLAALGPAEHADLVRVESGRARLAFHHPLVRSTVVDVASDADRATAHRCLAGALADDTVRHARHLAEASPEPDEAVAALLETASRLVLRRGDALGASSGLLQAADLSPDAEARSRRLAEAAYLSADVTGELGLAAELLVEARRADPSIRDSLRAAVAAAHLQLNAEGDVTTAHRLLVGALDRADAARAEDLAVREEALLLLLRSACTAAASSSGSRSGRCAPGTRRHSAGGVRRGADPVRACPGVGAGRPGGRAGRRRAADGSGSDRHRARRDRRLLPRPGRSLPAGLVARGRGRALGRRDRLGDRLDDDPRRGGVLQRAVGPERRARRRGARAVHGARVRAAPLAVPVLAGPARRRPR
jgi:hypothetical protein